MSQIALLDPVCLLLFLPEISRLFFSPDRSGMTLHEKLMRYLVSEEKGISHTLRRHFWWYAVRNARGFFFQNIVKQFPTSTRSIFFSLGLSPDEERDRQPLPFVGRSVVVCVITNQKNHDESTMVLMLRKYCRKLLYRRTVPPFLTVGWHVNWL